MPQIIQYHYDYICVVRHAVDLARRRGIRTRATARTGVLARRRGCLCVFVHRRARGIRALARFVLRIGRARAELARLLRMDAHK